MKKCSAIVKKGAALAVMLAVLAIVISSAWAVGKNSWDSARRILTIEETLGKSTKNDPASGGVAQAIRSLDINVVSIDIASIDTVIIKPGAAAANTSIEGALRSGDIVTWEDMVYLGSPDIFKNLRVVDMRGANTLQNSTLWVADYMKFLTLEKLYMPEGIEVISGDSFSHGNLPKIKTIVFPSTLKHIENSFHDVSSKDIGLTLVFTNPSAPVISGDAFLGSSIDRVIIPSTSVSERDKYLLALGKSKITDFPAKFSYATSITPSSDDLGSYGGTINVVITGSNLPSDLKIAVDGVASGAPAATSGATVIVGGVNIPRNDSPGDVNRKLTVLTSKDVAFPGISANVTVRGTGYDVPGTDRIISVDIAGNIVTWVYSDDVTAPQSRDTSLAGKPVFRYPESRFALAPSPTVSGSVSVNADALLIPEGVSLDVKFEPVPLISEPRTFECVVKRSPDNKTYFEVKTADLPAGHYKVTFESKDCPAIFRGTLKTDYAYGVQHSITLSANYTDKNEIVAYATVLSANVPVPGVPVTFKVTDTRTGVPVGTSPVRNTDTQGMTDIVTLTEGGLGYGVYNVEAITEDYGTDAQIITIEKLNKGGGGCSTAASPLLLIVAVALMASGVRKKPGR
jgi:hypothetical protein